MEPSSIKILLAEDNTAERELFKRAMKDLSFKVDLTVVEDGAKLMAHLKNCRQMPDLLFLDLNMPLKNGSECLSAIKNHPKFKNIPVIIYSTSYLDEVLDVLYSHGAHYYLQKKIDSSDLRSNLEHIGTMFINDNMQRPERNKFFLNQTFKIM